MDMGATPFHLQCMNFVPVVVDIVRAQRWITPAERAATARVMPLDLLANAR
jgi:hypothetical protein